ncbi:MAG: sigma-70 family RNA polymerase sigma factor [Planctomycetes bacterium]|nr:sigma-70 family RNA polymerase sigma factor [Planctomycetota bacterium]
MVPPARDPQFLLEHSGFVRELVRRLVFDPELARDVEQQTWLAALRNQPPAADSARAWLSAIARNLARRAWRAKARREERELDPHPQAATPTPAEILEREALRREVIEALLALEEPWRETLVLHFLEELTTHAVAERMGVPHETVRTRVKRGLELLRARLERRTHLHGAALSLALVEGWRLSPPPLAVVAASVSSLSIGAALMSTAGKSLVAAAALVTLLAAYRFTANTEPALPEEPRAAAESVETLQPRAEESVAPSANATSRSELPQAVEVASPTVALAAPELGTLLVRARWTDGSAAPGVGFVLHSANATDYFRDATRHWTGADGSVRVERVPLGRVTLYSDRGSSVRGEARAGETTEVVLPMQDGFTLKGRVLDVDRTPVPGAEVFLWECVDDPDQGWVVARSDARGEYTVRGLGEMLNFVSARAAGRTPTVQRLVMSNADTTVEVDLVFEHRGGSVRGRVLDEQGLPLAGATVVVGGTGQEQPLRLADGAEGRAPAGQRVFTGEDGDFVVEGVPTGTVSVQARGRGYAVWSGSVEVTGTAASSIAIQLSRGARIEGTVRTRGGEPVARAQVSVDVLSGLGGAFRLTRADGSFSMDGLTPGPVKLRVAHDELGSTSTSLSVAEGQTARAELVLSSGLVLRVRVDGRAADWTDGFVHASVTAPTDETANYYRSARIDSRGIAELTQCPEQPLRIELYAPGDAVYPRAVVEDVLASIGELVIQPDPARIGKVQLVGRIVDARGEPVGSARIVPSLRGQPTSSIEACDGQTGRFAIGPVSPGQWSIHAQATGYVDVRTPWVDVASGETHDFGELVMQRGARLCLVGLRKAPAVRACFEDAAGARHELHAVDGRWLSEWIPEGRGWLVTGGGAVALAVQRVDLLAGETQEVRVFERNVEPRRLRRAGAQAGEATRVDVRDGSGVSLGVFAFEGELGTALVPLANGRYELRLLAQERELGRRTLDVTDAHGVEPIELALD